jgi:predicted DNA-binding transcriptional regulator YafY
VTSTAAEHDKLAQRLAGILLKLNQGESLDPPSLAEEFKVNLRTIQRDLNERFAFLPLEKVGSRYRLDPLYLGKLAPQDLERFAGLAGLRGLFPSLSIEFLRELFDTRLESTLLIRGHHYEDLQGKLPLFRQIEAAVRGRHTLSFDHVKEDGRRKAYVDVEPYKLLNHKGIWYLAAHHGGKLKTFAFTGIERVLVSEQRFEPDPAIEQRLIEDQGIWLGAETFEVVLKVDSEVAPFFKRRPLIANQVIEKQLADGGLLVSAKVAHVNQILPIVRYWIPHLRIVSPEGLQAQMERELSEYLRR